MRKPSNSKQSKKQRITGKELILYCDYLDDPKKQKVANILAYSGWNKENRRYGAITSAARAVGVNRMTVYEWLKDEKLIQAIDEAKAELCAMAMNGLRELVKDKNFGACAFLLERLQPEQFSQQHKRMKHEKELIELEDANKYKTVEYAPPTIIIESVMSKDYDRNKLD